MKWGTKFGPEYVNRLHSMVSRHLSLPHHFVCFTDNPDGLNPGIRALPLPTMYLPEGAERGWRKLSTFTAPLADLAGPTLFLDVDIVIVGSLDGFFEHSGAFCIIKDWARPWRVTGNSSVYRFQANAHSDIFAQFLARIDQVKKEVRNEQEYLSREIHKQGKLAYWPSEWCVSFKYSCIPRFPLNFLLTPKIPPNARIVVFHGKPTPADALAGHGKGVIRHVKPTRWIAEHWR